MDNQILAHTKYNCTYHIVFIPKYRRKVMYGKIGKEVGEILSTVCKITGVKLMMIFDRHSEYRDKYGRHFWARGYYAETIGQVNEEIIKKYIEEQEECSRIEG